VSPPRAMAEHPSPATLLDYYLEQIPSEELEPIQDHLASCAECSRRFLLLEELPSVPSIDEDLQLSDRQTAAEWALLRTKVDFSPPPGVPRRPSILPRGFSLPYALAASLLLITTLGLAFWVHRLLGRVAELSGPQLHLAVADLVPVASRSRDGDAAPIETIRLSPDVDRLLMILNLADWRPFAAYDLRITDAAGKTVWVAADVVRGDNGNFLLTLPRAFLPPGAYSIRLSGRSGGGATPLAEYSLRIAAR
jgi:hypothetical protein